MAMGQKDATPKGPQVLLYFLLPIGSLGTHCHNKRPKSLGELFGKCLMNDSLEVGRRTGDGARRLDMSCVHHREAILASSAVHNSS